MSLRRAAISFLAGSLIVTSLGWGSPRLQSLEEILPKVRTTVRNNMLAMNWNVVFGRGRTTPLRPGEFVWALEFLSFKGNPPAQFLGSLRSGDYVPYPNPIVGNVFNQTPSW